MENKYTLKEFEILNQNYCGTEACPQCGLETDFSINPLKKITFACSHCGYEMLPCSLCDCGSKCGNCEDTIRKTLIEYNTEVDKELEEENDMENGRLMMCVYYTTIEPAYGDDDNLAYIEVDRDIVESYFDNNIADSFHSKIGCSTFENWLIECTADDTLGLWIFCHDRDSVYKICKPDGTKEILEEKYCKHCDMNIRPRECETKCYRCGKEIDYSFIDDEEKMIDFFFSSKNDFLKFYSYLDEKDYNATINEVIKRSGYWNDEWREANTDKDGRELRDILFGLIATDWLRRKKNNPIMYNAICYMVEQGMTKERIEKYVGATSEEIFEQCGFDLD